MRLSTFNERMQEAFGAQASWLARDHVFAGLGQRTVQQALDAGEDAREVWLVVHSEMRLPATLR
ncbi:Protein of unknown function (DUF3046) [Motilibacter peucedani]|uniref:DUF3046 family protein n=1 Tax=Motilibacter peucedani TaxID=598650 RepID=A0A420XRJ5_9ACTN|nr:DUF3046 domain-containing protein [Motilibacter peucedani]RKS77431.1 Protein of unknown function (DUF3046) [Motilibacter peucedani]